MNLLQPSHHSLDTIWGNETARQLLLRLMTRGRLPHALLLHGPGGVGKRSFAFAAAKLILSTGIRARRAEALVPSPPRFDLSRSLRNDVLRSPDEGDVESEALDLFGRLDEPEQERTGDTPPAAAIGEDEKLPFPVVPGPLPATTPPVFDPIVDPRVNSLVTRSYPLELDSDDHVVSNGHVDLNIIEPPGKSRAIKVEQIRFLQEIASVPPVEGSWRVVLVFGADTITPSAANSLLKWLEEPPPYLVMILVTDHYHRVLETIRSRCSAIPFHPMEAGALCSKLVESGVEPGAARAAAAITEGRPGAALDLLNQGLLKGRSDAMQARLGLDRNGLIALPGTAHRVLASAGGALPASLVLMMSIVRDRLLHQVAPREESILVHGDLLPLYAGEKASLAGLHAEWERLVHSLEMERHPFVASPQCVLELALWPEM